MSVCVYVCMCVYVYMCICIYVYVHVYVYVDVYIYTQYGKVNKKPIIWDGVHNQLFMVNPWGWSLLALPHWNYMLRWKITTFRRYQKTVPTCDIPQKFRNLWRILRFMAFLPNSLPKNDSIGTRSFFHQTIYRSHHITTTRRYRVSSCWCKVPASFGCRMKFHQSSPGCHWSPGAMVDFSVKKRGSNGA